MKVVVAVTILLFSMGARANLVCADVFLRADSAQTLKSENANGKPLFYSVRNNDEIRQSDLAKAMNKIISLDEFAQRLEEVSSFIPVGAFDAIQPSVPRHAFYIANRLTALVEAFLIDNKVTYVREKIENPNDPRIYRTRFYIGQGGTNKLNELARILGVNRNDKTTLVIDPLELFLGLGNVRESQGEAFPISRDERGYRLSLFTLVESQKDGFRVDFNFERDLDAIFKNREIQAGREAQLQSELGSSFNSKR